MYQKAFGYTVRPKQIVPTVPINALSIVLPFLGKFFMNLRTHL